MTTRRDNERAKLQARKRDLERQLDSVGPLHAIPLDYAENFAALYKLALAGRAGGELAHLGSARPESRPPKHNPAAYARFQAELRELRQRGRRIEKDLNDLELGGDAA